jgi:hypothetical protein
MQQETTPIPHAWLLLSNVITAVLAVAGTLSTLWFKKKREPAEIRKIDAEARSIHIATEISPVGITLETLREIQSVIRKAEERRQEWEAKEDQMRGQILFWRNKAEELDGELIDSREANGLLDIRLKHHEKQEEKLIGLLKYHNISYAELDHPTQ